MTADSRSGATVRRRKPRRAKQLGVTDDEYARLLASQDGHCALCPATPKTRRLHVDHDHGTGRVRGLLCHRCNRGLPTWVTAAWLNRAAAYLAQRGGLREPGEDGQACAYCGDLSPWDSTVCGTCGWRLGVAV